MLGMRDGVTRGVQIKKVSLLTFFLRNELISNY